jgi:predicted DNA-binding protein (UPF0251 family)/predicted Fe-Mo cluster-binding NifX family protein
MPRPLNERRLCAEIESRSFKPAGVPCRELEEIVLECVEAEALRLADLEGLYQEAAARRMNVSRPTFGRILESARRKVADAMINGKCLRIEGGDASVSQEGETYMKIAAPSRDGQIDEHFGHCKEYLVFSVNGKTLAQEATIPSLEGCGCKSGIAADLAAAGVTHMVAGNMGAGAVRVLGSHGITVVRGAQGDAKAAVQAFVDGKLADSGLGCSGHSGGEGHECAHD